MPAYTPGIDVSHWQGAINWKKVRAAGVLFAFIKASEGTTFQDPSYLANWQAANTAGILCGPYHFFQPLLDAQKQAELFLRTATFAAGDLPPALDMEGDQPLKPATYISRIEIWVKTVQDRTGLKPIIYSSPSFLDANFQIAAGGPPLWARDTTLWLANWQPDNVAQPVMPYSWNAWTFWQHSSTGSVNGISNNVDLDWYPGTVDQLYLWAGHSIAAPITYIVKAGDTLETIAGQFNLNLEQLVKANPQLAVPGNTLTIPQPGSSGGVTPPPTTYIVQPGDTLSAIAARFGKTVAQLAALNHIANPDLIFVGQVLTTG